jgi:hypothetical protein
MSHDHGIVEVRTQVVEHVHGRRLELPHESEGLLGFLGIDLRGVPSRASPIVTDQVHTGYPQSSAALRANVMNRVSSSMRATISG